VREAAIDPAGIAGIASPGRMQRRHDKNCRCTAERRHGLRGAPTLSVTGQEVTAVRRLSKSCASRGKSLLALAKAYK
jgi:hypothetical protein